MNTKLLGLAPVWYSQIRLKTTVSAQQIFQSLVRNKQFKFSRIFEIKTNLVELAELKKRAKIWTAYFWPKIGRSAARKWSFPNVTLHLFQFHLWQQKPHFIGVRIQAPGFNCLLVQTTIDCHIVDLINNSFYIYIFTNQS